MPGLLRIREERGSPGREGVVMEILLPLLWTVHFPPSCGQNVHLSRRGEARRRPFRANCAHSSLRMLPSPPRFSSEEAPVVSGAHDTTRQRTTSEGAIIKQKKKGQGRDRVTTWESSHLSPPRLFPRNSQGYKSPISPPFLGSTRRHKLVLQPSLAGPSTLPPLPRGKMNEETVQGLIERGLSLLSPSWEVGGEGKGSRHKSPLNVERGLFLGHLPFRQKRESPAVFFAKREGTWFAEWGLLLPPNSAGGITLWPSA